DRIYVGGCSAGGYMTLNMLLQYPGFFAAAFPVCEAYPDKKITDSQLGELSKVPLWFTRSKDDETIKMENPILMAALLIYCFVFSYNGVVKIYVRMM
ncbi:MAG: hypothetical protein ACFNQD_05640, partial [Prevotella intermedia]